MFFPYLLVYASKNPPGILDKNRRDYAKDGKDDDLAKSWSKQVIHRDFCKNRG